MGNSIGFWWLSSRGNDGVVKMAEWSSGGYSANHAQRAESSCSRTNSRPTLLVDANPAWHPHLPFLRASTAIPTSQCPRPIFFFFLLVRVGLSLVQLCPWVLVLEMHHGHDDPSHAAPWAAKLCSWLRWELLHCRIFPSTSTSPERSPTSARAMFFFFNMQPGRGI
jgi:hypothetical protein